MIEPTQDEDQRRVAQHIADMANDGITRGLAGDVIGAVESMAPLFHQYGPNEAYAWLRVMLRLIPAHDCGCGGPFHAIVAQRDTITGEVHPRDIDDPDVPPGVRTLARMIAANANGDDDTVHALWTTLVDAQDSSALAEVMHRALRYAVDSVRERGGHG